MKYIVTGHARHGKDTVCEMLAKHYELTHCASSIKANELFIFDKLKKKYHYETALDCFNDRVNHRKEWFDLIVEYNSPSLARLGKSIFQYHDIYCGIRNKKELDELKRYFNQPDYFGINLLVFWIDASDRLPPEDANSMSVTRKDADFVIDNNGDLDALERAVLQTMRNLRNSI